MFELLFEGRVQGRGTLEKMREMRSQLANFNGYDISVYQIVEV